MFIPVSPGVRFDFLGRVALLFQFVSSIKRFNDLYRTKYIVARGLTDQIFRQACLS